MTLPGLSLLVHCNLLTEIQSTFEKNAINLLDEINPML
jgi:hypothetical protein